MKKRSVLCAILALVLALGLIGCGNKGDDSAGGGTDLEYSLEFPSSAVTLVIGEEGYSSASIVATAKANGETDAGAKPEYSVADENVATYSDGVITAAGKGKTTLTATWQNKTASVAVEVREPIAAMDVSDESKLKYYGRNFMEDGALWFHNTASGFETSFIGTALSAGMKFRSKGSLKIFVDGKESDIRTFDGGAESSESVTLASGLTEGLHTVKVLKMTEQGMFKSAIESLECDGKFVTPAEKAALKFEFYGDSITCGYGNLPAGSPYVYEEDGTSTYATMTSEYFCAEHSCISYSGLAAALGVNGIGYTCYDIFDTYSERNRSKWDFSRYVADIVVINLGTNDANMIGDAGTGKMISGYKKLLAAVREKQSEAVIFCVYGMMGVVEPIEESIIEAVETSVEEGMQDVYYFRLDANGNGAAGHPDMEGHRQAATTLESLIERFGKLK